VQEENRVAGAALGEVEDARRHADETALDVGHGRA
jgi:hypothetical protein